MMIVIAIYHKNRMMIARQTAEKHLPKSQRLSYHTVSTNKQSYCISWLSKILRNRFRIQLIPLSSSESKFIRVARITSIAKFVYIRRPASLDFHQPFRPYYMNRFFRKSNSFVTPEIVRYGTVQFLQFQIRAVFRNSVYYI